MLLAMVSDSLAAAVIHNYAVCSLFVGRADFLLPVNCQSMVDGRQDMNSRKNVELSSYLMIFRSCRMLPKWFSVCVCNLACKDKFK